MHRVGTASRLRCTRRPCILCSVSWCLRCISWCPISFSSTLSLLFLREFVFSFFFRFIWFYFLMGECHRLISCLCLCYFDVDRFDFNINVYFSSVTSHFLLFWFIYTFFCCSHFHSFFFSVFFLTVIISCLLQSLPVFFLLHPSSHPYLASFPHCFHCYLPFPVLSYFTHSFPFPDSFPLISAFSHSFSFTPYHSNNLLTHFHHSFSITFLPF